MSAEQLAFISFAAVIFLGSFILMLPVSHRGRLHYVDSLFTSTSTVCVTGLTVVDIGTKFTFFGQFIILLLIQVGGLGVITILSVESGGEPHTQTRGLFLELLLEATSAFGTVGLSTGVTPRLESASKLALSFLMFVGRVGPMTLIYAMSRSRPGANYHYPGEQIMIG